jgi:hypothetical protein
MPRADPNYKRVQNKVSLIIPRIDCVLKCCLLPKCLKKLKMTIILNDLKSYIIWLESYNNLILAKNLYFPELEETIKNSKQMYNKYLVITSNL